MGVFGGEDLRNIKLTLAYDGTGFAGFQRQRVERTVQAVVEDELARLTGEQIRLTGAGRTDAGVHALAQVINFHTAYEIETARYIPALNSLLPPDVAVTAAEEVPDAFNARRSAKRKTYHYRIWRSPARPVFERDRVYHFKRRLDLPAMAEATALIVGRHDFAGFCSAGSAVRTSTREIFEARWEEQGGVLAFTVTADGFLYRMVRNLVGSLLEVGLGKRSPGWLEEILAGRDRRAAGPCVPPGGLFLVKVEY
jgi:tRNA pseudouridine38-40 synthase